MSNECVLCGREMHRSTKPYWIIDPETLYVRGLAHKGCRDELKYGTVEYYLTKPVEGWTPGEPVESPSRAFIEFAAKMIRYKLSLPQWETDVDFKVLMLLWETFKASSVEELLELPKTKRYFDWWQDPKHRNPMPDDEVAEVKRRLRENLGEAS